VDRALAVRSEDRGKVVRGVVVRALLVAERPAARVVERVRALDEAHAAAVLLDDLLPRRALRLQAGDALAGRAQLVAEGLHLSRRRSRQPRAQVLLARPVLLDALLEGAALGVGTAPLRVHALLERAPLRVHFSHRLAQGEELPLEAAVLAPGPAQQARGHDGRRHHRAAEGPAALRHRA